MEKLAGDSEQMSSYQKVGGERGRTTVREIELVRAGTESELGEYV